jgi:hypothetical protein
MITSLPVASETYRRGVTDGPHRHGAEATPAPGDGGDGFVDSGPMAPEIREDRVAAVVAGRGQFQDPTEAEAAIAHRRIDAAIAARAAVERFGDPATDTRPH